MSDSSAQHARPSEPFGGVKSAYVADHFLDVAWQTAHDLRQAATPEKALSRVARAIAEARLYQRAGLILQNTQGEPTAVGCYGVSADQEAPARLIQGLPPEKRRAILAAANRISNAYFVRAEQGLDFLAESHGVASERSPDQGDGWQPSDALFVLLRDGRANPVGHISVDTPFDGRRPDLPTIHRLELLAHLAEEALARVSAAAGMNSASARLERLADTDQRKLTEQLAESERAYRLLADNTCDLIYTRDLDGNVSYASPSVRQYLDVLPEEVVGTHFADWIDEHPLHRAAFEALNARICAGETVPPFVLTMRSRAGRMFFMEFHESLMHDETGAVGGIQGVGRDVTASKKTEDALRKSEERFRELADMLPQAVYEMDLEGRLTFTNRSGIAVFGYTDQDYSPGKDALEFFIPEDRPKIRASMQRMLQGGASVGNEYTAIHKDGSRFPVIIYSTPILHQGQPAGFRGIILDLTERKQAEQALRESQRNYQELFNSIVEGIGVVDEDEIVRFCNPAYARIFGIERPEALIGRSLLEFVSETDRALILAQTQVRRRGESSRYELEIITGKGSRKTILVSVSPRFDGSQRYIGAFGAVLDITKRKRAEDALRASEANYRMIFDAANEAIFIHDFETGDILDVNRRMCEMYGYTVEEARHLSVLDLTADEQIDLLQLRDPENTRRQWEEAIKEPRLFEWRAKDKSGRVFWVEVNLKPVRLGDQNRALAVVRDITERKEALETLRRSEETARALLNTTGESAMLTDVAGRVLAINDTAARMLGGRAEEMLGMCVYDILPPAVGVSQKAQGEQVVRSGRPVAFQEELGGERFEGNIHPLFDAQGRVERLAVFARDVTEREQMLRQLRRKSEELDRANSVLAEMVSELHRKNRRARELAAQHQAKNAELQAMVSMLSHDLKAPLISIREQAALFHRRYAQGLDEGAQTLAHRISANADGMLRLVDSLLDYARAEDYLLHADDIDLDRLVDDLWEQIIDAFPGRAATLRRSSPGLVCRFSRSALERVLANLLRNAALYVPAERAPEVEVGWTTSDRMLTLTVGDNGCGIPPEEKEKIFDLFYRAQPSLADGSGVGLAVVKRVVDAAGGSVTVSPRVGGGTVFSVDLPLAPPPVLSA